jgi:hypothetical protein
MSNPSRRKLRSDDDDNEMSEEEAVIHARVQKVLDEHGQERMQEGEEREVFMLTTCLRQCEGSAHCRFIAFNQDYDRACLLLGDLKFDTMKQNCGFSFRALDNVKQELEEVLGNSTSDHHQINMPQIMDQADKHVHELLSGFYIFMVRDADFELYHNKTLTSDDGEHVMVEHHLDVCQCKHDHLRINATYCEPIPDLSNCTKVTVLGPITVDVTVERTFRQQIAAAYHDCILFWDCNGDGNKGLSEAQCVIQEDGTCYVELQSWLLDDCTATYTSLLQTGRNCDVGPALAGASEGSVTTEYHSVDYCPDTSIKLGVAPTTSPTTRPTYPPTIAPTAIPSSSPTAPTSAPTTSPTYLPSHVPTAEPTSGYAVQTEVTVPASTSVEEVKLSILRVCPLLRPHMLLLLSEEPYDSTNPALSGSSNSTLPDKAEQQVGTMALGGADTAGIDQTVEAEAHSIEASYIEASSIEASSDVNDLDDSEQLKVMSDISALLGSYSATPTLNDDGSTTSTLADGSARIDDAQGGDVSSSGDAEMDAQGGDVSSSGDAEMDAQGGDVSSSGDAEMDAQGGDVSNSGDAKMGAQGGDVSSSGDAEMDAQGGDVSSSGDAEMGAQGGDTQSSASTYVTYSFKLLTNRADVISLHDQLQAWEDRMGCDSVKSDAGSDRAALCLEETVVETAIVPAGDAPIPTRQPTISPCSLCGMHSCQEIEKLKFAYTSVNPTQRESIAFGFDKGVITVADTIGACIFCEDGVSADPHACIFTEPASLAQHWQVCDPLCEFTSCTDMKSLIAQHFMKSYSLGFDVVETYAERFMIPVCFSCPSNFPCSNYGNLEISAANIHVGDADTPTVAPTVAPTAAPTAAEVGTEEEEGAAEEAGAEEDSEAVGGENLGSGVDSGSGSYGSDAEHETVMMEALAAVEEAHVITEAAAQHESAGTIAFAATSETMALAKVAGAADGNSAELLDAVVAAKDEAATHLLGLSDAGMLLMNASTHASMRVAFGDGPSAVTDSYEEEANAIQALAVAGADEDEISKIAQIEASSIKGVADAGGDLHALQAAAHAEAKTIETAALGGADIADIEQALEDEAHAIAASNVHDLDDLVREADLAHAEVVSEASGVGSGSGSGSGSETPASASVESGGDRAEAMVPTANATQEVHLHSMAGDEDAQRVQMQALLSCIQDEVCEPDSSTCALDELSDGTWDTVCKCKDGYGADPSDAKSCIGGEGLVDVHQVAAVTEKGKREAHKADVSAVTFALRLVWTGVGVGGLYAMVMLVKARRKTPSLALTTPEACTITDAL